MVHLRRSAADPCRSRPMAGGDAMCREHHAVSVMAVGSCVHYNTDVPCTCRKPRKQSADDAFLSVVAAIAMFAALVGLLVFLLCTLLSPCQLRRANCLRRL